MRSLKENEVVVISYNAHHEYSEIKLVVNSMEKAINAVLLLAKSHKSKEVPEIEDKKTEYSYQFEKYESYSAQIFTVE